MMLLEAHECDLNHEEHEELEEEKKNKQKRIFLIILSKTEALYPKRCRGIVFLWKTTV